MRIMIIGAGIGGLTTALSLHAAGLDCVVVESAAVLRPLGVGINLQSHATRELTELGLADQLADKGVETTFITFTDRFGGEILSIPRGRSAGYLWPQYSIHRGELQMILRAAVEERIGPVRLATRFERFEQDGDGVEVTLRDAATGETTRERVDVLVGADGVHSSVRAQLHPEGDPLRWTGIRMWRGIADGDRVRDGATVFVAGTNLSVKFVAYHISPADPRMVNWVAEVKVGDGGEVGEADWSRTGRLEDVARYFADWKHSHVDVMALLKATPRILEYPMVDRDPLESWGQGRVTLLGDAAHPMYPIGSNGGSQAVLDARVLARCLATIDDPAEALAAYEAERRPPTSALVLAHRALPVEETISLVMERAPHGFADIADVLTPEELAAMTAAQRGITDMDVKALNERESWSVVR
ncbi:flavin-dependent oxidoreductase [Nonomuraea rhodomycinica]|uniref:Flavin-dependent oxidoreductase n=2 Tax=Nonomuraea rhodomycinica TaxID=1712872 RepID=A0A7Y6IZI8_9ACTN|nr:flavin-dependent oxidoreductase [Nonomuraea rhodomycinica]